MAPLIKRDDPGFNIALVLVPTIVVVVIILCVMAYVVIRSQVRDGKPRWWLSCFRRAHARLSTISGTATAGSSSSSEKGQRSPGGSSSRSGKKSKAIQHWPWPQQRPGEITPPLGSVSPAEKKRLRALYREELRLQRQMMSLQHQKHELDGTAMSAEVPIALVRTPSEMASFSRGSSSRTDSSNTITTIGSSTIRRDSEKSEVVELEGSKVPIVVKYGPMGPWV